MKNQQKLLVRLSIAFAVLFFSTKSFAQLKVGTNPTQINKASILELEADRQGFLLPRLTDTAAINTLNPPDGMLIYLNASTNAGKGLYIRKAGVWQRFATDSISLDKWSKQGDVLAGTEKLGSLNAQTLKIITNNIERVLVDGNTGDVTINNSASVGNSLTVADSTSTKSLIVADSVEFQNLNRSTDLTEVLVVDTSNGGSIRRRTIATDAFKNWVVGSFRNTANANGLQRIAGATADTLVLHAATAATPGGVSTETQDFGGNKTFVDSVTASKTLLVGNTGTANSALEVQGSVALSIRTVTASATLANNDYTVLVDASGGAVTLTLPTPSASINGRTYIIKKIAGGLTNDVILSGAIEDGTSMSIYNDWTVVKLQTNGSRWYVIK
jgi:hypothetical protein